VSFNTCIIFWFLSICVAGQLLCHQNNQNHFLPYDHNDAGTGFSQVYSNSAACRHGIMILNDPW